MASTRRQSRRVVTNDEPLLLPIFDRILQLQTKIPSLHSSPQICFTQVYKDRNRRN
jgi:hypothetical protein